MIDAVLNGYGIAYIPENIVERHIASGDLVLLQDEWSPPFEGYYIYYPSSRQNSPAFRVIIHALRHREVRQVRS
jgi:DNA-binding transcriptional LysR family regulator